ncbi:UvrD-helicase domain-containing protein [Maribellus mangrovi]|uniref:UvrD-helicase domain-containing protein n=1 Tax=Maribellus mangrovi TaxID=3133146 RepID=UPI0030ED280C
MASIYPDLATIKKLHQKPTEGELVLLTFLDRHLSSEFEIFFQPFINGDRPDIVILKRNAGIAIIEVKDWDLDNYYIDENTDWYLKKNDARIKSPLSQVKSYKDNLLDLHVNNLLEKKINNRYYNAIISTVVYFHNEYEHKLDNLLIKNFESERYTNYRTFVKYIHRWGKDSLTNKKLMDFLSVTRLNRPSRLFDDELYHEIRRYLQPPFHMKEEGKSIVYTKQQEELVRSEQKPRRKIKGLAGSGKTFVLAKRAVNAYLRTNSTVLILTYNLSLKNYIHDRINEVREDFPWDDFYITNYHQFFKAEANNYGLEIRSLQPFNDTTFFEPVKDIIKKYSVILIDEIQDYSTNWLEIITKFFLEEGGEFVVFGDEKQNIYNRPLDENNEPVIKTIPGNWNKSLNTSKRFANEIGRLAIQFQNELLSRKYSIDELQILENPTFEFDQKILQYFNFGFEITSNDLFLKYSQLVKGFNIHPSDVCILSATVDYLREIDYLIRTKLLEKTTTTFETKELWEKLKKEITGEETFKKRIENVRRNKKNHFWMKTGTTKLSSIHSFKGWESHTIFVLIEPEILENQFETVELIYTAITRAQLNLFIFNMGNNFYDSFFRARMTKGV